MRTVVELTVLDSPVRRLKGNYLNADSLQSILRNLWISILIQNLLSHITEEALVGANELTEAELQADLITNATANGTSYFCSGASVALAGSTATAGASRTALKLAVDEVVTYNDLMNLSIALDDNKTPKQTKIIAGSRMVDTKTVNGGRVMYIGSELIPVVRKMTDISGSGVGSGFVGVEKYADAGNILNGEIGSVDQFRIVVVPEMQHLPKTVVQLLLTLQVLVIMVQTSIQCWLLVMVLSLLSVFRLTERVLNFLLTIRSLVKK